MERRSRGRASPRRTLPPIVRTRLHTSYVEEAGRALERLYSGLVIEPGRGRPFRCELDVVQAGPLSVVTGRWLTGGSAHAAALGDCYPIALGASGQGEVEHGGARVSIVPFRAGAIGTPGRATRVRIRPGFEGRSVILEREPLETHLGALTGQRPRASIAFEPAIDFESESGASLLRVVRLVRLEVERPDASPLLIASLTDALMTAMLTCLPHDHSASLAAAPVRATPRSVRRTEEYIAAHFRSAITLADLVAATGVPARSLQAAFQASRGTTPMGFLRARRLDAARLALMAPHPETTVARVALELGFRRLARFCAEYEARFRESPHETLARHQADD